MKSIFIIISIFTVVSIAPDIHPVFTDRFKSDHLIDAENIPYTNVAGIYNIDAAIEAGALLYDDTSLGLFGSTSCSASSCHVKSNHLAPVGLQIGTGGVNTRNGREKLKYYPTDYEIDMPAINSPQAENIVFRKRVLHDCATTPTGQISDQFGGFVHSIDYSRIKGNPIYQHYFAIIFGSKEITQKRFQQLILIFQESNVSSDNRFQRFLKDEIKYKSRPDSIQFTTGLRLFYDNCIDCHYGKDLAGQGLKMDKVITKPGTDISFLRSGDQVAVRSPYNNDAFDRFGWVGDYKSLSWFMKRHRDTNIPNINNNDLRKVTKWLKNLND